LTPQFVSNLKEQNFKEIAAKGSYTYGYLCPDTFKLYYVGVARTAKRPFAKTHNTIVPTNRNHVVILKSGLTREQAAAQEKRYVARYGRLDKGTGVLHNRTEGGAGTRDLSPDALARRNEAIKATNGAPEVRAKVSEAMKAIQRHPEARARTSAAVKARYSNPEERARTGAAIKAALNDPEVRAKHLAALKAVGAEKVAKGAAELGISVDAYRAMTKGHRFYLRKKKREANA
jgi:hypothetical protein